MKPNPGWTTDDDPPAIDHPDNTGDTGRGCGVIALVTALFWAAVFLITIN